VSISAKDFHAALARPAGIGLRHSGMGAYVNVVYSGNGLGTDQDTGAQVYVNNSGNNYSPGDFVSTDDVLGPVTPGSTAPSVTPTGSTGAGGGGGGGGGISQDVVSALATVAPIATAVKASLTKPTAPKPAVSASAPWSTGAKVVLGVGLAAAAGGGLYLLTRPKGRRR